MPLKKKRLFQRDEQDFIKLRKGRNQILHLHFSQYCLEHLHLPKAQHISSTSGTKWGRSKPGGGLCPAVSSGDLHSALKLKYECEVELWCSCHDRVKEIKSETCCAVRLGVLLQNVFIACQSSHQAPELQNTTLNSLHNITTRIPFIIPGSFTLQGKGEQKEEYFSSPSKYPILSFQWWKQTWEFFPLCCAGSTFKLWS